ncbi:hypothetical protein ACMD2_17581 [Ananas comosus]|uniref:HAT C-terminal dimerisation domain-containing protein n=1 Tax=Ananas comosus TaxID=4615 RepID=A0A199UCX5_ANACO|nr:hypothetical protein ACMD2_17581 [Ananas comosus]
MSQDLHLAGYYLYPSYHHHYNLGFDNELLKALRNVINRLEKDPIHVALAISEEKIFRESSGTFGEAAEWWLHYGGSAKHLKNIVVRVLSQTTTSSECERNWSTFALIHTKVRNRLAYARLEKLVYIHYNMRLRLRCMQEEYDKEKELKTYDHLDTSFINNELDPILDCLQDRDNQKNPLLDEPGDSP